LVAVDVKLPSLHMPVLPAGAAAGAWAMALPAAQSTVARHIEAKLNFMGFSIEAIENTSPVWLKIVSF
jgi:hypothetical protein